MLRVRQGQVMRRVKAGRANRVENQHTQISI